MSNSTKNTYDKENTLNNRNIENNTNHINNIRERFYKIIWENIPKKRVPVRLFHKPDNQYGVSYENDKFIIYKIIPDMSIFGHYKAYKKELNMIEYIKVVKSAEKIINKSISNYITINHTKRDSIIYKKTKKGTQYYLFDIDNYSVKNKKSYKDIELKAKEQLKKVAIEIWNTKQNIENDSNIKFIKSFSYVAFPTDKNRKSKIEPYIKFDDNGKLVRGCKKYWNYLKKELSKLSHIPSNKIII